MKTLQPGDIYTNLLKAGDVLQNNGEALIVVKKGQEMITAVRQSTGGIGPFDTDVMIKVSAVERVKLTFNDTRPALGRFFNSFDDAPSADEYGVGDLWIGGNQYWSNGDIFLTNLNNIDFIEKIHARVFSASENGLQLNYIVTGDSTRATPTVGSSIHSNHYYNYLLSNLNIISDNNAESGQTGVNWKNNVGVATLNQCLSLISGTGKNSIVEYSFGINDYDGVKTYDTIKSDLKTGIESLLTSKPDVLVLLVNPVKTGNDARNIVLYQMYKEISAELNLPLVDAYSTMKIVHGDSNYYKDSTHPNEFGQKRLINKIIDSVIPNTIISKVDVNVDLYNQPVNPVLANNGGDWSWNTGTGAGSATSGWRALEPIRISHGATSFTISHQGNRRDVICMDAGGNFIKRLLIDSAIAPERLMFIPYDTAELRINISSNGASYDSLNDDIKIQFNYMRASLINKFVAFSQEFKF